jgi:hypothetical protein
MRLSLRSGSFDDIGLPPRVADENVRWAEIESCMCARILKREKASAQLSFPCDFVRESSDLFIGVFFNGRSPGPPASAPGLRHGFIRWAFEGVFAASAVLCGTPETRILSQHIWLTRSFGAGGRPANFRPGHLEMLDEAPRHDG